MSAATRFRFREAAACDMCGADRGGFRFMGHRLDRHQGLWPRRRRGVSASIVRCGSCGLVFPDPMPLPESVADLYDMEPDEYWRDEYFQIDPTYFDGQIQTALRLIERRAGLTALDVGAGLGKAMLAMEAAGFEAHGIEPAPAFHSAALDRMNVAPDRLRLADLDSVDYEVGSFDFITFGAVLEHLPNPFESLRRCAAWLRPGGVIHAEVPSATWLLSGALNLWYGGTLKGFVTNTSPMHPPFHLFEFTRGAFDSAAERTGLRVVHERRFSGTTMVPHLLKPPLGWLMEVTGRQLQLEIWMQSRG
jgi:SAM-dependent methyltransferase